MACYTQYEAFSGANGSSIFDDRGCKDQDPYLFSAQLQTSFPVFITRLLCSTLQKYRPGELSCAVVFSSVSLKDCVTRPRQSTMVQVAFSNGSLMATVNNPEVGLGNTLISLSPSTGGLD